MEDVQPQVQVDTVAEASTARPHPNSRKPKDAGPLEPLDEILRRRLTVIKEGDNVLLKLPSDSIKAVVASKDGLVHLGKFGTFPASELLGLPYDIEYEIAPGPDAPSSTKAATADREENWGESGFGQAKSKKHQKKKGGKEGSDTPKNNPGWLNILRPLKRRPIVDAVIEDIKETNEFIEDSEDKGATLLSQEEIEELRAQGVSAEEMIQRQMSRHDQFELKTDFSKEKWRKRKERKYLQTVQPMAPSSINIVNHYAVRSPQSILYLREDTLSQLLNLANIRPGGRYLVVDDTGGLVTAAIADRMGCEGRILLFNDADSPPAWGVLNVMNFGERELSFIKWLNWMEAEEDYSRPGPPAEDDMPSISANKSMARMRRHNAQVAELNATRNELHSGGWDSIILATEMSPLSVIHRLTKYLAGSGTLVAYSPYQQVLAEALQYTRRDPNFLATALTESWTRTYQVLPGRTHPTMTTSAMGGYLLHATRVFPSTFVPESHQRHNNKRRKKNTGDAAVEAAGDEE
ncbi:tRNA (adenine(58)-N(1))-methyltransferase non-catalytic subunit trm6 [Apiotrichum porosum]|uniref:tRNA (adenine(58)-N(1))-methyltransferase non-catalytic subunit TRM6 n=1 Tax=Apiotrichum porosum TaxID=105984 RepID=A0A427XZV9_9TREE|nr:tRNA (adenine(58)-N(1))-methyltransferase non-catalytic subunit trm6 [Apiotrichum porosum]RSH84275.1 tRNA (adenine(58)-N(1))-methyltransferase non-catalytic subunit trm6 [Apiotrichum porosum]